MTQTIGQKLKTAREEKQLTLEKVFEAIRIRVPYLQALEADDLSSMPSPVQARGYLRNYAEFLELDIDQLLEEMRSSKQTTGEIIGPDDFTDQPTSPPPVSDPEQQPTPPPAPEIDVVQQADPQLEPEPVKPKRRGRKKIEPFEAAQEEPESIPEPQPEMAQAPIPEQLEPFVEEAVETVQKETHTEPRVSDKVWQTWLNRIGSVISVRSNRKAQKNLKTSSDKSSQPEEPKPERIEVEASPTANFRI